MCNVYMHFKMNIDYHLFLFSGYALMICSDDLGQS